MPTELIIDPHFCVEDKSLLNVHRGLPLQAEESDIISYRVVE